MKWQVSVACLTLYNETWVYNLYTFLGVASMIHKKGFTRQKGSWRSGKLTQQRGTYFWSTSEKVKTEKERVSFKKEKAEEKRNIFFRRLLFREKGQEQKGRKVSTGPWHFAPKIDGRKSSIFFQKTAPKIASRMTENDSDKICFFCGEGCENSRELTACQFCHEANVCPEAFDIGALSAHRPPGVNFIQVLLTCLSFIAK